MMPVIRISDHTWERLKGYAQPLEDTAEDIVVKALDALDRLTGKPLPATKVQTQKRAPRTRDMTPQKEFRGPLLRALSAMGGAGRVKDIRNGLAEVLTPTLREGDLREVSSGEPRWWNAICWERSELVKEGLLKADSERGVWELSESGRRLAKKS